MLILALDTTSRAGSVAVIRDGQVVVQFEGSAAMTHGARLPAELMVACQRAGVQVGDLDVLAVAAGPGSFTGLRIGIATVQGLAMARGLRIVPVSTLEAIAAAAPGSSPRVAAWMDALRGEVYAQVFERRGQGHVRPLVDATAGAAAAVLVAHRAVLDGAVFHGDGAIRYAAEIRDASGQTAAIATDVLPLAGAIGAIAAAHPDRAVLPHAVVPVYVRRPDVEITRDRRVRTP